MSSRVQSSMSRCKIENIRSIERSNSWWYWICSNWFTKLVVNHKGPPVFSKDSKICVPVIVIHPRWQIPCQTCCNWSSIGCFDFTLWYNLLLDWVGGLISYCIFRIIWDIRADLKMSHIILYLVTILSLLTISFNNNLLNSKPLFKVPRIFLPFFPFILHFFTSNGRM